MASRLLAWIAFGTMVACAAPAELPDSPAVVMAPATVCGDSPTTVFGIDVSKWQGTIDWAKVAGDGVEFAFIRVSDGTGYIDQKFAANWSGAQNNGILRGPYQFFRSDESPEAQAQILIDHLDENGAADLPAVIDVESVDGQSAATIAANVRTWIDLVEDATGLAPVIYTGGYFWNSNVKSTAFAENPLWVAHWTSAACPNVPTAWDDWTFWQYSATGRIAGIAGDVDLDRFDGTLDELRALGDPGGCGDCGLGAECHTVAGEPTCVELRCLDEVGAADGSTCVGTLTVLTCTAGVSRETACGANETCVDDGSARCVAVTPEPEPVAEPVSEPPPEPPAEPPTEPTVENDALTPAPDAAGAQALHASRGARSTTHTFDEGCANGPPPMGLWLLLPLFIVRRRSCRSTTTS